MRGIVLRRNNISVKNPLTGFLMIIKMSVPKRAGSGQEALRFSLIFVVSVATLMISLTKGIAGDAEMVTIPAGTYDMGSRGDDYPEDERPRHRITLEAFSIDRFEVTNEMFARFLNEVKPGEGKGGIRWNWIVLRSDIENDERSSWYPTEIVLRKSIYLPVKGFEQYPVTSVSWHAAEAYCRWAGKRLPTEAEWEGAARGGLDHADFPWGNTIPPRESGPVFGRKWNDNLLPSPMRSVGNYPPNAFGLYDMAGNVSEWCSDWYSNTYYGSSPSEGPQGPQKGHKKVLRGGSWASLPVGLRVAVRYSSVPTKLSNTSGFRCARDISD